MIAFFLKKAMQRAVHFAAVFALEIGHKYKRDLARRPIIRHGIGRPGHASPVGPSKRYGKSNQRQTVPEALVRGPDWALCRGDADEREQRQADRCCEQALP